MINYGDKIYYLMVLLIVNRGLQNTNAMNRWCDVVHYGYVSSNQLEWINQLIAKTSREFIAITEF